MSNQQKMCNSIASFVNKWETDKDGGKKPSAYGYLKARVKNINEKDITSKTGEEYHIHEYTLDDGTVAENGQDDIVLGVFMDKDKEETFVVGDIIDCTDIMAKSEFKGKLQLTTTRKTKLTKAKPGSMAKSSTGSTSSSGMNGQDMAKLITMIEGTGSKIIVAIQEMQVAILDQLKETIKAITMPASDAETWETEGSAEGQDDSGQPGEDDSPDDQSS